MPYLSTKDRQRGATLIELLVAMLITAFGLLGLVGLQSRTAVTNLEGYQRAQALVLVNDIAQRINLNRKNADSYIADDIGATDPGTCTTVPGAARDLCEWAQLLRGAAEQRGSTKLGAMMGARGCVARTVTNTVINPNEYIVSVVWQGVQASGPTPLTCGTGQYPDENLRRGVSVVIRIGVLA